MYSFNGVRFEYLNEDIVKEINKKLKELVSDAEYFTDVLLPEYLNFEYDEKENCIFITNDNDKDICIVDNIYELDNNRCVNDKFVNEIINYICLKQYNDLIDNIKQKIK